MSEAYIDCLRLDQYERQPFIAENGWIAPKRDPSAKGFVFAIFDREDELQFIGFSKDIRSSLRNMYYRQPDKCDGYRFVDLPELDKKQMASIRDAWLVQEDGRVPPGLGDEKDLWLKPPRGDAATWDAMLASMRAAGLREDMEIDAGALERDGSIELLPSRHELTPQEAEEREEQARYDRENTFAVAEAFGKRTVEFEMYIALDFKTNGGRMFDVDITMNETTTSHRVTASDGFLELVNVSAAEMLKRAFVYLFGSGCIRSTDRNTPTDIKDFPINYFSMNQVRRPLTRSLAHSLAHAPTHSLSHSPAASRSTSCTRASARCSRRCVHTHSHTPSLTRSLARPLTRSLAGSFAR